MSESRPRGKTLELGKTAIVFSSVGLGIKLPSGKRWRLKFPWANPRQGGNSPAMATDGYAQDYVADGYAQDSAYAQDGAYDNAQYGAYDQTGYDYQQEQSGQGGRFSIADWYQSDWGVWVLLLVLPPLGIYLLWQRNIFRDIRVRMGASAVSLIWFVLLMFWLFSRLFGGGGRPVDAITSGVQQNQTTNQGQTGTTGGADNTGTDGTGTGGGDAGAVVPDVTPIVVTDKPTSTPMPTPTPALVTCYMTETGTWYHKTKNCQGMQGAVKTNTEAAKAAGKTRCSKCWDPAPAKGSTKSNSSSGSSSSATTLKKGYVWLTTGGTYYHIKRTCTGMQDATQQTLTWAANHKYKRCPKCKPPTSTKATKKPAKKTTPKPPKKAKG